MPEPRAPARRSRREGAALLLLLVASPALATTIPAESEEELSGYEFAFRDRVPVAEGDVEVAVEVSNVGPAFGYFPLRVSLRSRAPGPRAVRLAFAVAPNFGGRAVTREVELAPGESRTTTLPVPVGAGLGDLRASGPGLKASPRRSIYFSGMARPRRTVLSLGGAEQFQALAGSPPSATSPGAMVFPVPASEAPEELAAYVGFDAVVLPEVALEELGEGQRRALEAYAATGGTLVVGRPTRALSTHLPGLARTEPGRHRYGFGRVEICPECEPLPATYREPPVSAWEEPPTRYGKPPATTLGPTLLPQAAAPVGKFLLIIVAFTLAIGPGSVLVARRRGTQALLITIPATAALACALIVAYSLFKDGFVLHSASRGYTLLDSKRHRAVTAGVSAYYANLAPAEARFSTLTALLPANPTNPGRQRSPALDWSAGLRAGADFIPSRSYREWGLLSVEPTRARLVVTRDERGYLVRNALGSHARAIHFAKGGKHWKVEDLADGAERRAEERTHAEPIPGVDVAEHADRFDESIPAAVKAPLEEGDFLAHVAGPSLLPAGGLPLVTQSSEHLIRGEVER